MLIALKSVLLTAAGQKLKTFYVQVHVNDRQNFDAVWNINHAWSEFWVDFVMIEIRNEWVWQQSNLQGKHNKVFVLTEEWAVFGI